MFLDFVILHMLFKMKIISYLNTVKHVEKRQLQLNIPWIMSFESGLSKLACSFTGKQKISDTIPYLKKLSIRDD